MKLGHKSSSAIKNQIFEAYQHNSVENIKYIFENSSKIYGIDETMGVFKNTITDYNQQSGILDLSDDNHELTDFISNYFNVFNDIPDEIYPETIEIGYEAISTGNLMLIKKYGPIAFHSLAKYSLAIPEAIHEEPDFDELIGNLDFAFWDLSLTKKYDRIKSLAVMTDYSRNQLYEHYNADWPMGTAQKFVKIHKNDIFDILKN